MRHNVRSAQGDETEGARLPRGSGWYRKRFKLPSEWEGRALWLLWEGPILRPSPTPSLGLALPHP